MYQAMTTPQGERILVLASDEALREMGFLPEEEEGQEEEEEEASEGGRDRRGAARRVLLRIPGGGARGEYGPDDYEALSSLDEGLRPPSARAAPVSQELLDMLPTHEHHCREEEEEDKPATATKTKEARRPSTRAPFASRTSKRERPSARCRASTTSTSRAWTRG